MERKQRRLEEEMFWAAYESDPIVLLEDGEYERLEALFAGRFPVDDTLLNDVPPAYTLAGGDLWCVDHPEREDTLSANEDLDELPF